MKSLQTQYKVDINASYEWTEEATNKNISHRELEVFALVTEGYTNKEIAQILKIKHQSVKNHMYSFLKKLEVRNGYQGLIIALHMKLIKVRVKMPFPGMPVREFTAETYIDNFRKLISGESWDARISEKDIRQMKVWLKEHGIDPLNW